MKKETREQLVIKKQRETIADLKARLKAAYARVLPLIDMEIGEGTRGEVTDPLHAVAALLNLKNKSWRTPKGKS